MTEDQYHKIKGQLWLIIIIATIEVLILFLVMLQKIESIRCHCSSTASTSNENIINMQNADSERSKLIEKVLERQGQIYGKADMLRIRRSEDELGSGADSSSSRTDRRPGSSNGH